MNAAESVTKKTDDAPDEGWLPLLLNIVAIACIIGGVVGALNASPDGLSWLLFFGGIVNSMLVFAASAVVKALREIEHHTRR